WRNRTGRPIRIRIAIATASMTGANRSSTAAATITSMTRFVIPRSFDEPQKRRVAREVLNLFGGAGGDTLPRLRATLARVRNVRERGGGRRRRDATGAGCRADRCESRWQARPDRAVRRAN